jgi:hypothetical protein
MSKRSNPEIKRIVDNFKSLILGKWMANGYELPSGTVSGDWQRHVDALYLSHSIDSNQRAQLNKITFKVKKVFRVDGPDGETF